jgi:hypothetical protein
MKNRNILNADEVLLFPEEQKMAAVPVRNTAATWRKLPPAD